jgi:serine/threonine-protein kinase
MPASADPRIGTRIAGYRLEELVGRGGMGVVYRAHDLALERSVALKLLSPSLAQDRDFRERFLVESRLAASLEHPNVVPIHGAGETDGQLYLAMRYVEGSDLKRRLQEESALEQARAIAICVQVAEALDAAHARGLVHRDVKPSNVLLDEEEHAYLADFGLTRRLIDQAPDFNAGLSLGTPAYVAPEQIEGKDVDGRADQYSLACLLHECLTGEPPFPRASEAATLFAHLEEEPPAAPGLEQVIRRALAKSPDERYASCRAFVADAHRAIFTPRRRDRRRWLGVAVVAVAALGASIGIVLTRDTSEVRGGPPAITQTSIAGATLGHMPSYYRKLFGGSQPRELTEPGFPSLAFQGPEVAVYFPVEGQAAHIMTTWNRDYRTAAGIGPCSTVEEMKEAYGEAVKPSWSGTSPDGKKVFHWVVGDNLLFATDTQERKLVRAVALYEGNPNNTLGGSPQAYAGYVAAVETPCKIR